MIVKSLNEYNPIPKNKRIVNKKILQDKKGKCEICGKTGQTEKHHIKTKGSGGDDTEENLIEVCRNCHIKAHKGLITKEQLKKIKEKRNG